MPRLRALLAVLLAFTWWAAAWHGELEAVGLMLDHQHHAPADHDAHDAPGTTDDHHDPVVARDVAKDVQVRVNASGVLWFALLGLAVWLGATLRPRLSELPVRGARPQTESPPGLVRTWQFVLRLALPSRAPSFAR